MLCPDLLKYMFTIGEERSMKTSAVFANEDTIVDYKVG